VIEPISRGVLDTRFRGYDDPLCDNGLLRGACHRAALCADPVARNDELFKLGTIRNCMAPASEWRLRVSIGA
jgi:hypothetical protein